MQDLLFGRAPFSTLDPASGGPRRVVIVAVGGFDPTGGAGVVRDLLTGRTLGARVRLVPTAWTAQSARTGVRSVEARDPGALATAVSEAIAAESDGGRVVVKVGMIPNAAAARAVLDGLREFAGAVVLDPVLAASSGGDLFEGEPRDLMALAARAAVVTPNIREAELLSGQAIDGMEAAVAAGQELVGLGARAVLVKGGHLAGDAAVDVLVGPTWVRRFSAEWLPGAVVRGTGCALATAIAVGLGRGLALEDAVGGAKTWLHQALHRAVRVGDEWHLD